MRHISFGYCLVGLLACVLSAGPARAALTIIDTTNISLANAQIESGGDTSDDPNVVNGAVGALIAYPSTTSSGSICCGATYDLTNLNDNDIGIGVGSDGTYALPNAGLLTLGFGSTKTLGSIAIYNGYGNRDDGTYTLRDGANNLLGSWSIGGTPSSSNDGVDSFWLKFTTPVTTNELRLTMASTDITPSFREIRVYAPVPEPATACLALVGFVALIPMLRRRLRPNR